MIPLPHAVPRVRDDAQSLLDGGRGCGGVAGEDFVQAPTLLEAQADNARRSHLALRSSIVDRRPGHSQLSGQFSVKLDPQFLGNPLENRGIVEDKKSLTILLHNVYTRCTF